MCTFITMIAASDDLEQINAILSTLDRRGYARRARMADGVVHDFTIKAP